MEFKLQGFEIFTAGAVLFGKMPVVNGDYLYSNDFNFNAFFVKRMPGKTECRLGVSDLLPHRGRMQLVEEIVSVDERSAACRAEVRPDWPLVKGGRVSGLIAVELVAQTAGISNGWVNLLENGSDFDPNGWIVGIKQSRIRVDWIPVGTPLLIQAENRYAFEAYREVVGTVEIQEVCIAEISLQLLKAGGTPEDRDT